MTTLLDPTPRLAPAPPADRPARQHRRPPSPPLSSRAGMARLADLPAGSAVAVAGGVLVSARVRGVRHEPSGSVVTLVARCPERLGAASGSVLTGRACPGPLQTVTLRWEAGGTTTSTRLPVEVAQDDVVVVFSRRSTGRVARRLALAEGRAPAW